MLEESVAKHMNRRPFDNVEFAYWLQGALEIADLQSLSEQQVMTIRRRINNVQSRNHYVSNIWLTLALLDAPSALLEIKKIQHQKFIHDIDPTYDGDQEHFNAVHEGRAD